MDITRTILIAAGCCLILCWRETNGQLEQNVTELLQDESLLPVRERFRRLIPYMTYYLGQGYNNQNQYVTANPQQYQDIQQVGHNLPTQSYRLPQQYQQQNYQLVPVGYLVGGGYRRVPVYTRPTQPDYLTNPYMPQQPTDFTRMISQNYVPQKASKDQRPVEHFFTKPQYSNQPQTPSYKISTNTKNYIQQELSPQQSIQRQPFYQKTVRPGYTSIKDDSYVELHNNYDTSYNTRQNIKSYTPDLNVMTITKSQEIKVPSEPNPSLIAAPIGAPTALPKPINSYEPSAPGIEHNGLLDLLAGYQLSKALPERVTSSNIGSSIQTLSHILRILQTAKAQSSVAPQDFESDDYDNGLKQNYSPYQTEGSTPGRAGIDYPAYSVIPETRFSCKNQRYKGFFGDPETSCQVWHYCDLNGGQASFLCPNGTIFSQVALTCDWWFNVKCASTAQLYVLNERLYKYILPAKPSFPEDYAGPLVDEYLTLKFQELEAKKKNTTTTEKAPSTLQVLLNDEVNQAVK